MNKSDWAYILIDKFHSGQATKEEILRLNEWKSASPRNNQIYNETMQILNIIGRLKDWNQYDEIKAWQKIDTTKENRTAGNLLVLRKVLAVAAVFLLFLTAVMWINFGSLTRGSSYVFSGESTKYSILNDGSEIFFNQNAKVDYSAFKKDNRSISASGDFFINVAHDAGSPFVIHLQDLEIKVLGTSFFIDENNDDTRIAVRDGKVSVMNSEGERIIVEAGKQLIATEGAFSIEPLKSSDWGLFSKTYNDEKLFSVLHDLADQFGNVSFSASNIDANCRITTKINQSTILEILDELSLIFNIDYTIKDGTVIVNKISC